MRQFPECAARLRTIPRKTPRPQALHDTKLINLRGVKYRNVTYGENVLGKVDLSKPKMLISYLDFHVNCKQTTKPGLSMR
jgi:hypothetical protein